MVLQNKMEKEKLQLHDNTFHVIVVVSEAKGD